MFRAAQQRIRRRDLMTTAFHLPGPGQPGRRMGKALAENFASARAVFDEVDAALGQKLSGLMWEGPEGDLTLTENAQPALMAVSNGGDPRARVRAWHHGEEHGRLCCRHSLGEYAALAAAGTFSLADAARLLRTRGAAPCRAPRPSASVPWRPCTDWIRRRRAGCRRSGAGRTSARPPTTTATGRGWFPATRRRSNVPSTSPRQRREARHPPAGLRALPLCPECSLRRCHGRSPVAGRHGCFLSCRWSPMWWPVRFRIDAIRKSLVAQVTGTVRWRSAWPIWPAPASTASARSVRARC